MVEEAWANGEDVPYGIVCVCSRPLTEREQQHAMELGRELEEERRKKEAASQ